MTIELILFFSYFTSILLLAYFSSRKQKSQSDFILGNRSLNFWLTALSAQASDMSSWLFMAYPALIFGSGLFSAWAAVGLIIGMLVNWHFIAPKLRTLSEELGSLTLSSYFENRFQDHSGRLRLISGFMSVLFFTFYISSGLVAMGVLAESLFGISYYLGITIGLCVVVTYIFIGGYRTVAWIDLVQGFFLLGVILFVPISLLIQFGGIHPVMEAVSLQNLSTSLFPDFKGSTLWQMFAIAAGWGLGYFGQPHILTKFMGIRHVEDMKKSKYLGVSWMILALSAATLVGLIGIYLFPQGLEDSQQVILNIVQSNLPSVVAGLVLCAILAATTNVMAAHILVVASNLSEDFYKRLINPTASDQKLLNVSRASVVLIGVISLVIAFFKLSTIYALVLYSWSGLGASFGPLILLSLYSKRVNKYGAFAGILTGGIVSAAWPILEQGLHWGLSPIIPAFALSLLMISCVSYFTQTRKHIEV